MNNRTENVSASRKSLIRVSITSLFAALIAAGTFISIPLPFSPVPIVLQNMFALLCGLVLGPSQGGAAVALYLVAGAIGLPVFAGAKGGFIHFVGPTGGFLVGYLLSAIVAGFIAGSPRPAAKTRLWRIITAGIVGMLAVYVPGVVRLRAVLDCSWTAALAAGFTPFIIGDVIKTVLAILLATNLRRTAAKALYRE